MTSKEESEGRHSVIDHPVCLALSGVIRYGRTYNHSPDTLAKKGRREGRCGVCGRLPASGPSSCVRGSKFPINTVSQRRGNKHKCVEWRPLITCTREGETKRERGCRATITLRSPLSKSVHTIMTSNRRVNACGKRGSIEHSNDSLMKDTLPPDSL